MRFPTSKSPSTEMPRPPTPDKTLRLINLIGFPLAIAFSVPYADLTDELVPALGLIPLSLSALLSLLLLSGKLNGSRISAWRILVDLFCAVFLLGVLIPGWVFMARGEGRNYWRSIDANVTMVGTYGTVPMMVTFVILTYITVRDSLLWLRRPHMADLCPHCHGDLSRPSAHPAYQAVHDHDGDEEAQLNQETGVTTPRPTPGTATAGPSNSKPDMLEIKDPKPESSETPRISGEYRDSIEDESAPLL